MNAACSGDGASEQQATADLPQSEADLAAANVAKTPVIRVRSYVGGSAKVTVTGSFQIDADIPINTKASYSDGEMTWLQYGASGAETPNSLVTINPQEVGLSAALGKKLAVIGAEACEGSMKVTANLVSGRYTCTGVTSHDPGEVGLGTVNIEISFTATS